MKYNDAIGSKLERTYSKILLRLGLCAFVLQFGIANLYSQDVNMQIQRTESGFVIRWPTLPTQNYAFCQYSRDLLTWKNASVFSASTNSVTDLHTYATDERLFFRLRLADRSEIRMFETIERDYQTVPILHYLRNEVHFVVIPILNPWGYRHYNRRCAETLPIPVSWQRMGDMATIMIDTNQFPDTNGRFQPENYITEISEKKLVISMDSVSDANTFPDKGYLIENVISPLQFRIHCSDSGATNGTATMFVLTDMNRQFDVNNWSNFSSLAWADSDGVPHSNKGTRPYALAEARVLKDILDANRDAAVYLDFHFGPPAPYAAYYGSNDAFDRSPLDAVLAYLSPSASEILVGVNTFPTGNSYAAQVLQIPSFTPETGSTSEMTGPDPTKSLEWWINILGAYCLLF
jgi:hypothetical protein